MRDLGVECLDSQWGLTGLKSKRRQGCSSPELWAHGLPFLALGRLWSPFPLLAFCHVPPTGGSHMALCSLPNSDLTVHVIQPEPLQELINPKSTDWST